MKYYGIVTFIWMMLAGRVTYAQRVYADSQTSSAPSVVPVVNITLAQVQNPTYATDNPYTNYSTLTTTLGSLSIIQAWQNITFTNTSAYNKPLATSPVYVKIGADYALAGLAAGISIQSTSAGSPVGTALTSTTLASLLGASATTSELTLTPGAAFDGVKVLIDAKLLGLGLTARYYYAFIIAAPNITAQNVCLNSSATLTISNFQSGYTYRWYDAATGGSLKATTTTSTYTTPVITANTTYYVEAAESSSYKSGRIPVAITVNPKPVKPNFSISAN